MRLKMFLCLGLLLLSTTQLFGQVRPAAFDRTMPLQVGLGFSNFATDWGTAGRISGPSLWVNWSFHQVPAFLNGLGVEIEARDLNYARTAGGSTLRFDTAAAGPIYTFNQHRGIHAYGQLLGGLGSMDFPTSNKRYTHDTRALYEAGGGVECLVLSRVRLRAGYEYQFWPDFFHHHALNPNGFTIGTAYDFGAGRMRVY